MIDFTALTQAFDLPIMAVLQGSDSVFFDRVNVIAAEPYTWIPLYVALAYVVISNSNTMWQVFLIAGLTFVAVGLSALSVEQFIKPFFMRLRPIYDSTLNFDIDIATNYYGGDYGFISGHAANTMTCAVFLSLIVRSRLFSIALILWSLLNCYTRIYLGVHYPSDVLAGILWGCLIAILTYVFYRYTGNKMELNARFVSSQYTRTGYAYRDIHIVIIVLVLTLIAILFRSVFEL